jgi:hypothetical protein
MFFIGFGLCSYPRLSVCMQGTEIHILNRKIFCEEEYVNRQIIILTERIAIMQFSFHSPVCHYTKRLTEGGGGGGVAEESDNFLWTKL